MSLPRTNEEEAQFERTWAQAGPTENLVSTACPACYARFALLGTYRKEGWLLRCVNCGHRCRGGLKP